MVTVAALPRSLPGRDVRQMTDASAIPAGRGSQSIYELATRGNVMVSTVVRELPFLSAPRTRTASLTRVVVVSDNPITRLGICSLLTEFECTVCQGVATGGGEARLAVARLRPDVAVVDLRLALGEWLSLVSDLARRTHVFVVSGSTEPAFASSMLRAGATSCVAPDEFDADQLGWAILRTGEGTPCLSPVTGGAQRVQSDGSALSRREVEVMVQVARGLSNADIAKVMFLSEKTVKNHLHSIFVKLRVRNRAEAIVLWLG